MKSEWPSGLRRYVQVVVYSVGVGSNPTSDSRFFLNVGTNSLLFRRDTIVEHYMKSEWPSGLRRYVQVVVYSVGVGSNPTSDSRFFFKCRN